MAVGWIFFRWEQFTLAHGLTASALFLFFFFLWLGSRGRWLGLGDAKLAGLIGLIFSPLQALAVVYSAIFGGALVAVILLLSKRANWQTRLPFGSFLAGFSILYLYWGDVIIMKLEEWQGIFLIFK